ncbi:molybdopterin-synthase adenylyltransferase MoeB [Acidovorax sp. NCPPB 2350]|nr:molybdopterin-synthase adenylyltransferase MoeB [Acidovorax sp. NCPPB 2350]
MKLPPLIASGEDLTSDEIARYSRHLLLPDLGMEGQRRLKAARVLVIGAGGLGSPVLLYLAAAGVGHIGIVEFDHVDLSNLQRQVIHGMSDLGTPKGESARRAIHELNPFVNVRLHPARLEAHNALEILQAYDLVIDGSDNFATRYLVNDACVLAGKPCVWGSIYRFEGQTSVFWESPPQGGGRNYRDLYPEPPPPELAPSCAEGGVLGVLCASIGSVMATEAIKLITGMGETLLGRLLVYDALDMSWRELALRQALQRPPITGFVDYPALCGMRAVQEAPVPSVSVRELRTLIDMGAPCVLIDVRESGEWDIGRIPGARHIPKARLASDAWLSEQPADAPIVLYCKSGARSRQALQAMHGRFTQARDLQGGILAWIDEIDPAMPRY